MTSKVKNDNKIEYDQQKLTKDFILYMRLVSFFCIPLVWMGIIAAQVGSFDYIVPVTGMMVLGGWAYVPLEWFLVVIGMPIILMKTPKYLSQYVSASLKPNTYLPILSVCILLTLLAAIAIFTAISLMIPG